MSTFTTDRAAGVGGTGWLADRRAAAVRQLPVTLPVTLPGVDEEVWAESVPNLEIENNDVRCSHASTVGPVDEDQRLYLESRGVPTRLAERLIVAGSFAGVLDQFPVPAVAPLLRERIEARLDRDPLVGAATAPVSSPDAGAS